MTNYDYLTSYVHNFNKMISTTTNPHMLLLAFLITSRSGIDVLNLDPTKTLDELINELSKELFNEQPN